MVLENIESVITMATSGEPEPKRVAPFIVRRPYFAVDPTIYTADQWRGIVAKAPIVRSCISTLILQLSAIPRKIVGDDEKEVEYYSSVLEHANEENFDIFIARLINDTLTVPFGGAMEVVRESDKTLHSIYHVDAGTVGPANWFYAATWAPHGYDYVQVDPFTSYNRVYFKKGELVRIPWQMRSDLKGYGWSITPVMDCFSAIESLVRSDIFYNTLLSDTPPPGVLDLLDMTREEAIDWAKSFRETFEGVDRLKIPVLYDHSMKAEWIPFQETGLVRHLPDMVKRYAEVVTSAFGMSVADLGLYEYAQTKAGSSSLLEVSKRQGLGALMQKIAGAFNSEILPSSVRLEWQPIDNIDKATKATAQKTRTETLKLCTDTGYLYEREARKMLFDEGIIVVDASKLNDVPAEKKKAEEEKAAKAQLKQAELQAKNGAPALPTPGGRPSPTLPAPTGDEETKPSAVTTKGTKSPAAVAKKGPKPPATVQKSLYGLVLDDGRYVTYDWERCEEGDVVEHSEAKLPIDPTESWYVSTNEGLRREFHRVVSSLAETKVRRIVDSVWDKFPEPESGVVAMAEYNDDTIRTVLSLLEEHFGEELDLSDAALETVYQAFVEAYGAGLEESARAAYAALESNGLVAGPLNLAFGVTNPTTIKMLRENVVELADNVDEGTRSIIARTIYSAVMQGKRAYGGRDSVAAAIVEASQGVIGERRARSIALFEINQCQSQAHLQQYETMGLQKKHWVSIPGVACSICAANDGAGFVEMSYLYTTVFGKARTPPGHPTVCHCRIQYDRQELLEMARTGELFRIFDGGDVVDVPMVA